LVDLFGPISLDPIPESSRRPMMSEETRKLFLQRSSEFNKRIIWKP
jgi:hypothetical protein